MGEKLFEWAFSILGGVPPMQNVAALLVVLFLAAPLLFDGIRKFRKIAGLAHTSPQIDTILETPILVQTVTRIHVEVEGLRKDIERLVGLIDQMINNLANEDHHCHYFNDDDYHKK